MGIEEKGLTGVIVRAAAVLRIIGDSKDGASLNTIAKSLQLARSTVQRIVAALETQGYVMPAGPAGGFVLGPEFTRLAEKSRQKTLEVIHPMIARLAARIQETVNYSIVSDKSIIILDQIAFDRGLLAVSPLGEPLPLHCSSTGKAYLSTLSAESISSLLGDEYASYTKNTRTNLKALSKDLDDARKTGVAFNIEELNDGVCAGGVVLRDRNGSWFGISIPVPSLRFAQKKSAIEESLLSIKEEIRNRLGLSD